MNHDATLSLLTLSFLVIANAFFVATEFALVRVRRTRIDAMIAEGNLTAKVVKDALDNIEHYISATQVGITIASLALGWLGEPVLANDFFEPMFGHVMSPNASATAAHVPAAILALLVITFIHVVLGELVPKNLSLQFPEKMSLYLVRPMRFCVLLFRPFIWLLNGTSRSLLRAFGLQSTFPRSLALSEEELLLLLSESKKAGVVSEDEQRMLQRVFKFHDKTVREIMKPRLDIAALELRSSEQEIKAVFDQGYSRLPVYDGNPSNIRGIVYVKDLIYTLRDPKLIKLVDLVREAMFVPETKAVSELLREFQRRKVHMAIVVDEFGDTAGLVTLEDVIEEIVGEIQDEYDYEAAEIERGKDGTLVFEGKTDLDRLRELFPAFTPPEGSFETVAGLVFQLAGRVPRETDVIEYGGLSFRILKREGRRLRKIAIQKIAPAPETDVNSAGGASAAAAAAEDGATAAQEAIGRYTGASESDSKVYKNSISARSSRQQPESQSDTSSRRM